MILAEIWPRLFVQTSFASGSVHGDNALGGTHRTSAMNLDYLLSITPDSYHVFSRMCLFIALLVRFHRQLFVPGNYGFVNTARSCARLPCDIQVIVCVLK